MAGNGMTEQRHSCHTALSYPMPAVVAVWYCIVDVHSQLWATATVTMLGCDAASILTHPPGQNGRHFADDIFKCIFENDFFCIFIKVSLMFVPKGPIENNPTLVQIMACCLYGAKADPIYWRICAALGGDVLIVKLVAQTMIRTTVFVNYSTY